MRPASTLLVFALLACSASSERLAVLTRPGEAGQLPGPERRVALAGETRPALCLPAGESFELRADPRTRRVTFAVGLRGGGDAGPVRFVVRGAEPASEPLFAVELASDAPGWIDGRIELSGRAPERLHFSTSRASPTRACWASLALLGRDGSSRPNVLVVSLDTLGAASLGDVAGGGASISPAIDAFLDEGFRFHRAYAQYPATLASHASLF